MQSFLRVEQKRQKCSQFSAQPGVGSAGWPVLQAVCIHSVLISELDGKSFREGGRKQAISSTSAIKRDLKQAVVGNSGENQPKCSSRLCLRES